MPVPDLPSSSQLKCVIKTLSGVIPPTLMMKKSEGSSKKKVYDELVGDENMVEAKKQVIISPESIM